MSELAIQTRTIGHDLETAVANLLAYDDPSFCIETDAQTASAALAENCPSPALAADMAALAQAYVQRTGAARIKLRLERVVGRGCRYFHVDYVDMRLITTYAGPGTEYVADGDADRSALGKGDNRRVVPDASKVRRLPTYAVAFFRGEAAPGNRGKGDIHRSPAATRKNPRLVFVVDAA